MPLVSNSLGARLRKQGDRFLIKAGGKEPAVSAPKVQSILIATAAHLSTDAVEPAGAHTIDLVFLGGIAKNRVEEIVPASRGLMDPATNSVSIFPMCREDCERVRVVGQRFERQRVADEIPTKVFAQL